MDKYPNSVLSLSTDPAPFCRWRCRSPLWRVLVSISMFGVVHEADEGASTHIWQLLMAGQVPIMAYFLVRWLRAPAANTICIGAAGRCGAGRLGSRLFSRTLDLTVFDFQRIVG